MTERFPIPGYGGVYFATEDGRIYSSRRNAYLAPSTSGRYLSVTLHHERKPYYRSVHRLVCEAVHGPPPTPESVVRHLDGDRGNNSSFNLKWGTASENQQDSVRHKTQRWARNTHCVNGHEFTEANTYKRPKGGRNCRECGKINARRYKANDRS